MDASAFLLAVLFGLAFLGSSLDASTRDVSAAEVTLDLVLGGIGCLLLWLRRRWPVGVAVAMMPIVAVSAFSTVAAMLAVFTVAVHCRTSDRLPIAAGILACSLLFPLWRPLRGAVLGVAAVPAPSSLPGWCCLGDVCAGAATVVWSLRERAERAETEQRMLADQARTAERARIAREMHDVLAHQISLIALHAGALEVRPEMAADEVRATAQLLRATARHALEELRSVIGVLRDDTEPSAPIGPQPTLADIPRLVDEVTRAGAKIDFDMQIPDEAQPPSALGRDAFRIVQEALTNVNKHARGTATQVQISGRPGNGLTIVIRNRLPMDNSIGAAALPGSGIGLVGPGNAWRLPVARSRAVRTRASSSSMARLQWPV